MKVTELFEQPEAVAAATADARDKIQAEIRARLSETDRAFLQQCKTLFGAKLRHIKFPDGYEVKR